MKIYDDVIRNSLSILEGREGRLLEVASQKHDWPDAGNYNLILKKEMVYELGGGNLPAITGTFCSSSKELVGRDEIWLYGPDLDEIQKDSSYARISILLIKDKDLSIGGSLKEDKLYKMVQNMDHIRYHINPKGYMTRVSTIKGREPVRISKKALKDGLNFTKVGKLYLEGYKKNPKVLAVKILFITLPDFPYRELKKQVGLSEKITEALGHILKNINMDCSTCNFQDICDEVEGMRELHFADSKES